MCCIKPFDEEGDRDLRQVGPSFESVCSQICSPKADSGASETVQQRTGISASDYPQKISRREGSLEARVRIELTYKGFADLSLTTWVPRLLNSR